MTWWKPRARRDGVVSQRVEGELVLYDVRTHQAFALNDVSAAVYALADGARTVAMISDAAAPFAHAAVCQALDELARHGLLTTEARLVRRQFLGVPVAAAAFVTTLFVPDAAYAASCVGPLGNCAKNACCPGLNCVLGTLGIPVCT